MAEVTNTNTKIGATAFKALTNKLPNIPNALAVSGDITASKLAKIIETIIWLTKLVDFIFWIKDMLSVFSLVIGKPAKEVFNISEFYH